MISSRAATSGTRRPWRRRRRTPARLVELPRRLEQLEELLDDGPGRCLAMTPITPSAPGRSEPTAQRQRSSGCSLAGDSRDEVADAVDDVARLVVGQFRMNRQRQRLFAARSLSGNAPRHDPGTRSTPEGASAPDSRPPSRRRAACRPSCSASRSATRMTYWLKMWRSVIDAPGARPRRRSRLSPASRTADRSAARCAGARPSSRPGAAAWPRRSPPGWRRAGSCRRRSCGSTSASSRGRAGTVSFSARCGSLVTIIPPSPAAPRFFDGKNEKQP